MLYPFSAELYTRLYIPFNCYNRFNVPSLHLLFFFAPFSRPLHYFLQQYCCALFSLYLLGTVGLKLFSDFQRQTMQIFHINYIVAIFMCMPLHFTFEFSHPEREKESRVSNKITSISKKHI